MIDMKAKFGNTQYGPMTSFKYNCKVSTEDAKNLGETFKVYMHVSPRGSRGKQFIGSMPGALFLQFKKLLAIAMLDYKIANLKRERDIITENSL